MPETLTSLTTSNGQALRWRHQPLCSNHPREAWQGLLQARQLREDDAFFTPRLLDLPNPEGMRDLSKAVELLQQALERDEAIHIFGDFDADGVNGAAILYLALHGIGAKVSVSIPHRADEGHGISMKALTQAAEQGTRLGISVDTGSSCLEACEYAHTLGLRMIITDHHLPGKELPKADAILNPARSDCGFADRLLCGTGVAYFMLIGLWKVLPAAQRQRFDLHALLDRVALATVADAMQLKGVNRILVHHGLRMMNQQPSPGLAAIIQGYGLENKTLEVEHISFHLAPRINAAGRMQHGEDAFRLLIAKDLTQAVPQAKQLDECNRERRKVEQQVLKEAEAELENSSLLAAWQEHWHPGVVGLVAGRLARKHGQPAAIGFSEDQQTIRLSLRGVDGFHIGDLLQACAGQLQGFGGHAGAGGGSLQRQQWPDFCQSFAKAIEQQRQHLSPESSALAIDGELTISALHYGLAHRLQYFAPTGRGNPPCLWLLRNVFIRQSRQLRGNVLRLQLEQQGSIISAVMFSSTAHREALSEGRNVSVIGMLEPDHWRGGQAIQFVIRELIA